MLSNCSSITSPQSQVGIVTDKFATASIERRLAQRKELLIRDVSQFKVVRKHPKLPQTDVLVAMVVYNEQLRLPDTLRHYRQLGVRRFAIVDNASTDSTNDYLCKQEDVDLYWTDLEFRTGSGCGWISALIHTHYGTDRWVIYSDADEQLVYDQFEEHTLPDLCHLLSNQGLQSLPALLLEMYSATSIASSVLLHNQTLIERCPWYDGSGYVRTISDLAGCGRTVKWTGGPSERIFGADPGWQAKTPLVYWESNTWYWNPHVVYPFELNDSVYSGAMLHFKYLSDFFSLVAQAVQRKQHASNSKKYVVFLQKLLVEGDRCLIEAHSCEMERSASLVKSGLMKPIDW
jgi:hypothetical protein